MLTSYTLPILIVCLLFFIAIFIFVYFIYTIRKSFRLSDELIEWLKNSSLKAEMSSSRIDMKLASVTDAINERIDKTMVVLANVQKTFGELNELSRTVKDVSLLFRNPKGRGSFGEVLLESLIKDILPRDAYSFHYRFKTGEIVDAVVKTGSVIVPIDSKFPMTNFNKNVNEKFFVRDIKKHIDDVSKKYIRPEENTTDYVLLYIPSETVFYEVISDDKLSRYAQSKRVMLTSPMSLYMYLKAIFMSYQGQKIQEHSSNFIGALRGLIHDFETVRKNYEILNRHINYAYKQSHIVYESLEKAEKQIASINRMENKQIQKPISEPQ